MKWLPRFVIGLAPAAVQRAHATVSAENAWLLDRIAQKDSIISGHLAERDRLNRALAAEQQHSAALARSSWQLTKSIKDAYRARIDKLERELDEATGPNSVTADNERLARELALLQEEKARQADTIRGLDAEVVELSGRLADALAKLAGYELEAGRD